MKRRCLLLLVGYTAFNFQTLEAAGGTKLFKGSLTRYQIEDSVQTALSPDGKTVATAMDFVKKNNIYTILTLHDIQSKKKNAISVYTAENVDLQTYPIHNHQWAFSPDGALLACYLPNSQIFALPIDDLYNKILIHQEDALPISYQKSHLLFSPDGRWLASGFRSNAITLWAVSNILKKRSSSQEDTHRPKCIKKQYRSFNFSPNGTWFAALCPNKSNNRTTMHIWNLATDTFKKQKIPCPTINDQGPCTLCFDSTCGTLSVLTPVPSKNMHTFVVDGAVWKAAPELQEPSEKEIHDFAYGPEKTLAVATADKVTLYDKDLKAVGVYAIPDGYRTKMLDFNLDARIFSIIIELLEFKEHEGCITSDTTLVSCQLPNANLSLQERCARVIRQNNLNASVLPDSIIKRFHLPQKSCCPTTKAKKPASTCFMQ